METPTGDRISDSDLAYHRIVISQLQAAQSVAQSWSSHLLQRYALDPADRVEPDGTIVRQGQTKDDGP